MAVESHDKKLDDLLKMVEEGKAQLPDFQRSWVWDDTKICKLIESITSGFPMGAAMLICLFTRFPHVLLLIVIMAGKELYMVVSGCLVIRKTGKVHGADWHGKIVTFLLYGTAAVHIIWFHITPMVSDLLIGLCAIMMVISVALYIIQNTRTLKGETV